jgi:Phosphotransferase enzyme family
MNLPPALTWMQLFPRGVDVSCEGNVPAHVYEMFARRAGASETSAANGSPAPPPRVFVIGGKPAHDLVDLPNIQSLAAINCPGVTTKLLESAGFPYARRFAVVPSFENPRWFVSLDSGAVAAGSFNIYTPARFSAHLKRKIASWAARLRLPIWYRDTIVIASRQPPPLERKLAELFPGQNIRFGLSAGAPEPAINRKASAAVLAANGKVLGFVKIAGSEVSRRIMEHEADVLPALSDRRAIENATPRLLFAGEVDGRYLTVQAPLQGKPAPAKMTDAHQHFLASLRCGPNKPAAETTMVASLPARVAALPTPQPEIAATIERFLPALEQMTVTSTIVHGDFAPWNLRIHRGRISAFDWEYGELDGLPLADEAHFTLQLGFQMQNWTPQQARDALARIAVARPLGLEVAQINAIHAVYLLDQIVRLLGEGYDIEHDMVAWYRQVLAKIDAPQREAVMA